jgi:hypothetical protein
MKDNLKGNADTGEERGFAPNNGLFVPGVPARMLYLNHDKGNYTLAQSLSSIYGIIFFRGYFEIVATDGRIVS